MIPKEKAKDLIFSVVGLSICKGINKEQTKLLAKPLASLIVDEIDLAIDFDWMEVQNLDRQHNYWQEVKKEIKKL